MRLRQFVPPIFGGSLLISLLLAFITPIGFWSLFGIAGAYLIANLLASIMTAAKSGWKHVNLLPIVLAILHLSYGSGFLFGLVKFANRWGDKIGRVPTFSR